MKLLVGLGNPDKEYIGTRHNTGFIFADRLTKKFDAIFSINKKINADIADIKINGKKFIIVKPLTFMNKSGEAVCLAVKYYKINKSEIVVIHDDKDIPIGQYRLQENRGAAGHKGVESIVNGLKTKNFTRLRIGIKPIRDIRDTADFVLKRFTKSEAVIIDQVVDQAIDKLIEVYS